MDPKPKSERPWLLTLKAPDAAQGETANPSILPADAFGLAMAGAGIEGMAFCLGVLQSLVRAGWLRHVDFLSTTGAGSGIGGLLGRIFDAYRGGQDNPTPGAHAHAARELLAPHSWSINWLRKHVGLLMPSRLEKSLAGVPLLVWAYFVFGLLIFSTAGLANAIRYTRVATVLPYGLAMPAGYEPEFMAGPWLSLAELAFFLAAVPLVIAWLLSSDRLPGSFIAPLLVAAATVASVLVVTLQNPVPVVVFAAAVLWVMIASTAATTPLLVRARLGRWLHYWFVVVALLVAVATADAVAIRLATWVRDGGLPEFLAFWLASLLVLIILTRWFSPFQSSTAMRRGITVFVVLIPGFFPLLLAAATAAHLAYQTELGYFMGLGFTVAAIVVSALLGRRECVQILNRLDPAVRQSARLASVILGAVNPVRRHRSDAGDVTHPALGDDVLLGEYHPELAGGPLHLINCAVEQTIDPASGCARHDRVAESMVVGPAGVGAGIDAHPPKPEPLGLALWLALSGVIADSHYWWESGLSDAPKRKGVWPALKRCLASALPAHSLIWSALTGQFVGPSARYWRLAHGMAFEPTGAYELLRRRVPFVIVCDADGAGSGLAGLIERVSVDFGIEVQSIHDKVAQVGVPDPVAPFLDTWEGAPGSSLKKPAVLVLLRHPSGPTPRTTDAFLARQFTWVLYLTATISSDDPAAQAKPADEIPWENYRLLGEHIGAEIFG